MASIEFYDEEHHDSYYPLNILFLIRRGNLNLKVEDKVYSYGSGRCVLVKRYTTGKYFKTFTQEEGYAHVYAVGFHEPLIKNIIKSFPVNKDVLLNEEEIPIIQEIKTSDNFQDYYDFLDHAFSGDSPIDEIQIQDKITKTLLAILEQNPEVLTIFRKISIPTKANLEEFMEYNYKTQLGLKELAKQSGRSLATFYRDFSEKFNETPHNWILNRRLAEAHTLLTQSNKIASQIYSELGFKDLAHFSKVFKKRYGIPPSKVTA